MCNVSSKLCFCGVGTHSGCGFGNGPTDHWLGLGSGSHRDLIPLDSSVAVVDLNFALVSQNLHFHCFSIKNLNDYAIQYCMCLKNALL